jgi:hypothetical protein
MAEVYNLDGPHYYAVAVTKQRDNSSELIYLKTKNTCHTVRKPGEGIGCPAVEQKLERRLTRLGDCLYWGSFLITDVALIFKLLRVRLRLLKLIWTFFVAITFQIQPDAGRCGFLFYARSIARILIISASCTEVGM